MEQARKFLKKVLKIIKKPEMRILPGQLAFFLVISLIPIIALIGTIASTMSLPIDDIKIMIGKSTPSEVSEILTSIINGKGLSFNIVIFFVSAFFLASNGPHSMIITSNEIYKIEPQNIIKRRIKAILMTIILVILFAFLLLIPVFGDSIFSLLKTYTPNKSTTDFLFKIYQLLKYPVIIIILFFNIKLMYILAPDKKITSKTTKGAIFTTIGWIISTEIYSIYTELFSKYDLFYGSISNVLTLLLWVYILSYIFVLGMVINASVENLLTKE